MKKRIIQTVFAASTLAICSASVFGFSGMNAYTGSANANIIEEFPCAYSAAPKDGEYTCYGSSEIVTYTAEEATAAGIPAGYENAVLKVVPLETGTSSGVLLDFTKQEVPVCLVENLQFRVFIEANAGNTGNRPQARIVNPHVDNSWIYQPGENPTPSGEWTEVVVENSNELFNALAIDGNLGKFEFSVRSNVQIPFYIDSIGYTLKANDGVAPTLSYGGSDTVYTNEGTKFDLNATAYDEQEARSVEVEYIWADPTVVQADGSLKKGTHELTLRAQDYYGNVAEKTLSIVVEEVDREFPVININVDTVYATIGTKPIVEFTAIDNSGEVTTGYTWSEGALDNRGRLVEGTHTLTLYAIDRSENRSQKVVTFYVSETGDPEDTVIDEETMASKYTVTFDGENVLEYPIGSKIHRPQDPTKEDENGYSYTFIGWYNGDQEWDFENDIITENLQLVSKYEKSLIEYRIIFRANGKKVAEVKYTVEDKEIVEPEVPEKSGYVGKWEEYTLTTGNITVKAVYTKIEDLPPATSETPEVSEKPEDSEVPEVSEKPEDSEIPEVSEKPEDSEVPEVSEKPEDSEIPEVSEKPEDSEIPEVSEKPEDSEIPEVSEKPEDSEIPETSEPTSEPEKESKGKGGCGGIATVGAIAMMTAVGTALLLKKKED